MRVAIIGAGIGGLTAAAALRANDIDVIVYERHTNYAKWGRAWSLRTMVCVRSTKWDWVIACAPSAHRSGARSGTPGREKAFRYRPRGRR